MVTLSIDDQEEITDLMHMMLTKIAPNGIHLTADNILQALELLEAYDVQIVFIDIEMPGINGLESARILNERYNDINIIFVTGHPEYSLEAFDVHPSGFLTGCPICACRPKTACIRDSCS